MDRTITTAVTAEDGSALEEYRSASAASWGAIIAGAMVAIGVSLILFALGTGLGFASISPWSGRGAGIGTFTVAAAIWVIVMQWVASIFGGYITGRLRTRWIGTHVHEIFFRDTANGLIMWALSTVVIAGLAASSAAAGISGATQFSVNSGDEPGDSSSAVAYAVDKLFRMGNSSDNGALTNYPRVEAGRILMNDFATGGVPDADRTYLAALVASRTGLSVTDSQKRVDDLITSADNAAAKVKAAADTARKDVAEVGIYTALSLLIGAFIASVSAALGGRLRDQHV